MKIYNDDFKKLFNEIGDLMSIIGENSFKIRAYKDVARKMEEEIDPITKEEATKANFKKIPGVGEALADKMMQYIETGKITYLEKLRDEIPKAVRDLLNIPNLGPNRVRDLYLNLGIKSKADIKKYAKNGKISELNGFGDKLVKKILEAIETGQEKKKRHERGDVEPIAQKMIDLLKASSGVEEVTIAGSYRREAPTIGDLDILVTGKPNLEKVEENIKKLFEKITILASGETKISFVIFPENLQIDIRFLPNESYGAALLYFTGSKDFNVMMRKVAIEKGYLLNEYGLFEKGEYIAGKTEQEVFEKLELEATPPNKRM